MAADYRQAQEQQEHEEWLETEVCPYCYNPQGNKRVCCGENHFIKAKELENETNIASIG